MKHEPIDILKDAMCLIQWDYADKKQKFESLHNKIGGEAYEHDEYTDYHHAELLLHKAKEAIKEYKNDCE